MNVITTILSFLSNIGIPYTLENIEVDTFLPGILLRNGALVVDLDKLLYPGDILHEAGHLAVMPPEIRGQMSDDLGMEQIHQGGEMMALAWSYAACVYLKIDPRIVFHEHGYKGEHEQIVQRFEQGICVGLPLLQWSELAYDEEQATARGIAPFPHMAQWLCTTNKYDLSLQEA